MRRREFIAAAAALLVSPQRSLAQSPRRIGVLSYTLENVRNFEAWNSGLREKGWIEGKNLLIEYRDAQTPDRFSALVGRTGRSQSRSAHRFHFATSRRP